GKRKVLLQGVSRGKVTSYDLSRSVMWAAIDIAEDKPVVTKEKESAENVVKRIHDNIRQLVEYEHLPEEMLLVVEDNEEPGELADIIIAHYRLSLAHAQALLEEFDPMVRLNQADKIVKEDLQQFLVSENIRDKATDELSKGQRDYFLREQLRAIQRELGEGEGVSEDLAELRTALEEAKLPPHAKEEADKQFTRLERMHPETSEYALLRTYLEWVADLPWSVTTKDRLSLKVAQEILDADHFGIKKAKERILEYLSVRKLKKDSKGPILCFVGPPGVGKTSLGRSIAKSLNRKFFRISLGGVRDEAEIRGHRRTYVGALPGRILQGLKEAGSKNPVCLLDEIDKVGHDFRGDPASALLEILDPEQNKDFRDHYLNINFDLSRCLFIATANTTDTIPDALLDRLEVMYLSGYTREEKAEIAKRYLVPRQLEQNGLKKQSLVMDDEALLFLVERYTRESGVRNLERAVGSLARKIARDFVETNKLPSKVDSEAIVRFLGPTQFDPEENETSPMVGLARGLAWTVVGGEVMPIEVSTAKGKGSFTLTGQLGDVMQESAQAALFYARANAKELGLQEGFNEKIDIHIHVPSGATPKDGPSAGITIAAALISALSNVKLASDVAMTGEITLRGNVLPVGGIKEKVLAAHRSGIKRVILPERNKKDLIDVSQDVQDEMEFFFVDHVQKLPPLVLDGKIEP
ncbi:MAG: endopeptidase La, partial [Bdellovibrionales bacterium]|nr:endopeptidase La [Bdellovibrionales bacterium]